MGSESLKFHAVVRSVAGEARRMGLAIPAFRSPPGVPGQDRTIRWAGGGTIVAIRLRGRPLGDIVSDVIEGLIVANRIAARREMEVRTRLLRAVEADVYHAA